MCVCVCVCVCVCDLIVVKHCDADENQVMKLFDADVYSHIRVTFHFSVSLVNTGGIANRCWLRSGLPLILRR